MSPVCKTADSGQLTLDQKVKVVLFYAETKGVVATQRRFRAHFGTRWGAPCKQTVYRLSLGTIFQPMRINSVPDVKRFCKNKNVLCVQSMVWHFVRQPVCIYIYGSKINACKKTQWENLTIFMSWKRDLRIIRRHQTDVSTHILFLNQLNCSFVQCCTRAACMCLWVSVGLIFHYILKFIESFNS